MTTEAEPSVEVEIRRDIVGGAEWTLVVSDSKLEPELEGNQGVCRKATQKLLINREETCPSGYSFVWFHELAHAVGWMNGSVYALQQLIGCDDEKMEVIEEFIVQVWFQGMFEALKQNGYLTPPDFTTPKAP
jgi:hypothetical protein